MFSPILTTFKSQPVFLAKLRSRVTVGEARLATKLTGVDIVNKIKVSYVTMVSLSTSL